MSRPMSLSVIVHRLMGPSKYTARLSTLEALLSICGYTPTDVYYEDIIDSSDLYKEITIVMIGNEGLNLEVGCELKGKLVTPIGLKRTAELAYKSLTLTVHMFSGDPEVNPTPIARLWVANDNPSDLSAYDRNSKIPLKTSVQLYPKNPNNIPGFGVYEEGEEEPSLIKELRVSKWLHNARIHTSEELAALPYVEPNMLELHRLAGPDFRYAVLLRVEGPQHHLVFQTTGLTKDQIFTRSTDALCRIIGGYKGKDEAKAPKKETTVAMP